MLIKLEKKNLTTAENENIEKRKKQKNAQLNEVALYSVARR